MFEKVNTIHALFLFSLQFAVEAINNIRTIKQLSVEKEVLHQYSESIRQVYRSSQSSVFLKTIPFGLLWGMDAIVLAFLFWVALILYEKKELAPDDIIM